MKDRTQTLEAVYERDIDLLLIEEFLSKLQFIQLFLRGSDLPIPVNCENIKAYHSYTDEYGEVDIRVDYQFENENITLWIENKIDALFQDKQIERYKERKQKISRKSYIILVAPKDYIQSNNHFDHTISYEQLIPYFDQLGHRGKYKSEILEIARKKLREGYTPVNDDVSLNFKHYYYQVCQSFPKIEMELPTVSPKNSTWVKLQHINHKDLTIWHKINNHRIDIEIPDTQERFYRDTINHFRNTDQLVRISKGYYIRINLDFKIVIDEEPARQSEKINNALVTLEATFKSHFKS